MIDLTTRTDPMARWGRALALVETAQREKAIWLSEAESGEERDRAFAAYDDAAEALIKELGLLAGTGVLESVTDYLTVTYGRV